MKISYHILLVTMFMADICFLLQPLLIMNLST